MKKTIWFMMGLSSQRDIIKAIKQGAPDLVVLASHQQARYEILSEADVAYIEPKSLNAEELVKNKEKESLLPFMARVIAKHNVSVIHVGRNCSWFEENRAVIESYGVTLFTGATDLSTFAIADSKYKFAKAMKQHGLPVVETISIQSLEKLEATFMLEPFGKTNFCIKPDQGIYGMGFWHFDINAGFAATEHKRIQPDVYLAAARLDAKNGKSFEPMVLMPFMPGPERSVDMIIDQGKVIAAVARRKQGPYQEFEISGDAFDLAIKCAETLGANGLVNVQTRNNDDGKAVLLEINLRPSGGVCFSLPSGVNLPALFAQYVMGKMTAEQIKAHVDANFSSASVRSTNMALEVPASIESLEATEITGSLEEESELEAV